MSDFVNRQRGTYHQVLEIVKSPNNTIDHILDNGDGTFSVMSHIVCEFCDYCAEQKDPWHAFAAKANPYEEQTKRLAFEEGWGQ